ncbi:MAG: MYXO-CTERM sorting domain-containing protein [Kofleriaceae bacterium]
MRTVSMIVLLASTASAEAAPTCRYATSYNDPFIHGACAVTAVEGCPIHVVVPSQEPPLELPVFVNRGGRTDRVASTTAVVGALETPMPTIDYLSCDCRRDTVTARFDELAITATDVIAGDIVSFGDGDAIVVAPPGPCTEPEWPSEFEFALGGCDLCPIDPTGDDDDDGSNAGGCSTSEPTGGLALVALALAWRRRRRLN